MGRTHGSDLLDSGGQVWLAGAPVESSNRRGDLAIGEMGELERDTAPAPGIDVNEPLSAGRAAGVQCSRGLLGLVVVVRSESLPGAAGNARFRRDGNEF